MTLGRRSILLLLSLLLLGGAAQAAQDDAARRALAEKNRRDSEAFLAANRRRPGVVTTPSGIQYQVIVPGSEPRPRHNDKVTIKFRWSRADGTKLKVLDEGRPVTVRPDELMKGFAEAVQLMPLGAKWRIYLPPALAFGEAGRGDELGPNSVLVIDCDLLSLEPAKSP